MAHLTGKFVSSESASPSEAPARSPSSSDGTAALLSKSPIEKSTRMLSFPNSLVNAISSPPGFSSILHVPSFLKLVRNSGSDASSPAEEASSCSYLISSAREEESSLSLSPCPRAATDCEKCLALLIAEVLFNAVSVEPEAETEESALDELLLAALNAWLGLATLDAAEARGLREAMLLRRALLLVFAAMFTRWKGLFSIDVGFFEALLQDE